MRIADAYELLKIGYESGRMAHSYIIEADVRGAGTELVNMLIKLVFCQAEKKPCGKCRHCREAEGHRLPDLYWIEPEKKSRVIAVEQVRDMLQWANMKSYEGGYKVAVIAYADHLNANAANAFLKTLEEPPDKTFLFLLVQNPQYLLPTIVSRCQKLTITGEFTASAWGWCNELADVLARPVDSVLYAQANAELVKKLFACFLKEAEDEISSRIEADGTEMTDELFQGSVHALYREKRTALMDFITMWYRDILMLTCGSENDILFNIGYAEVLGRQAEMSSMETALNNLETVEKMNDRLERLPVNYEMACLNSGFLGVYKNTRTKAAVR